MNWGTEAVLRIITVGLALQGGFASALLGQGRQLSLEANPVQGTLGYGWPTASSRVIGVEVGFGFPQLDRTLAPDEESLIDFLHLGVFVRTEPARRWTIDGRWQIGLAELRGCSGCLPGLFTALSTGVFVGGRHAKVGARLTGGIIKEAGDPATFVLNLTPLAALFTVGFP
jgi:hypothetical protein